MLRNRDLRQSVTAGFTRTAKKLQQAEKFPRTALLACR